MLSHSTFSGSAHLGGPAFINHVWVRRERRRGRSCQGPAAHHVSVTRVNKPLSNTLFLKRCSF